MKTIQIETKFIIVLGLLVGFGSHTLFAAEMIRPVTEQAPAISLEDAAQKTSQTEVIPNPNEIESSPLNLEPLSSDPAFGVAGFSEEDLRKLKVGEKLDDGNGYFGYKLRTEGNPSFTYGMAVNPLGTRYYHVYDAKNRLVGPEEEYFYSSPYGSRHRVVGHMDPDVTSNGRFVVFGSSEIYTSLSTQTPSQTIRIYGYDNGTRFDILVRKDVGSENFGPFVSRMTLLPDKNQVQVIFNDNTTKTYNLATKTEVKHSLPENAMPVSGNQNFVYVREIINGKSVVSIYQKSNGKRMVSVENSVLRENDGRFMYPQIEGRPAISADGKHMLVTYTSAGGYKDADGNYFTDRQSQYTLVWDLEMNSAGTWTQTQTGRIDHYHQRPVNPPQEGFRYEISYAASTFLEPQYLENSADKNIIQINQRSPFVRPLTYYNTAGLQVWPYPSVRTQTNPNYFLTTDPKVPGYVQVLGPEKNKVVYAVEKSRSSSYNTHTLISRVDVSADGLKVVHVTRLTGCLSSSCQISGKNVVYLNVIDLAAGSAVSRLVTDVSAGEADFQSWAFGKDAPAGKVKIVITLKNGEKKTFLI